MLLPSLNKDFTYLLTYLLLIVKRREVISYVLVFKRRHQPNFDFKSREETRHIIWIVSSFLLKIKILRIQTILNEK